MKKISLVILIIIFLTTLSGVTYAQSSDATKSADKKSEAALRTKERLEQLKDRRSTKSAQVKENVRDKTRRRAHVIGEITATENTIITIQTTASEIKTILTTSATKFPNLVKGGKKELNLND